MRERGTYRTKKTVTSFDRSIEPPFGESPTVTPPDIWQTRLNNGLNVLGVESNEVPLVQFSLRIQGGKYLDDPSKVGVANLITDIMMEGTANKTPEELEDALGQLGSSLNMFTGNDHITISGNCLSRYFNETMDLVAEILLDPRWDQKEFDRLKASTITNIKQRDANYNAVANNVFSRQLYGPDHILSHPIAGYESSVERIALEDLKSFYEDYFSPSVATFHFTGAVDEEAVTGSLSRLSQEWENKDVMIPSYAPNEGSKPRIVFVDIPESKVSAVRIGRLTLDRDSRDYTKLFFANNTLGNGPDSKLFKVLREEKGYTYGAYSYFSDQLFDQIPFVAFSNVRSNVTLESLETFKEIFIEYGLSYDEENLETTKNKLIKQNAGRYETLSDLITVLQDISDFDLPLDYLDAEQQIIEGMTMQEVKNMIEAYLNPAEMVFVVVGDKATQYERLKALGIGEPILVDVHGNELKQ